MDTFEKMGVAWLGFVASLVITSIAGWGTHVVVCIQNEQWLLLIGGAVVFPLGIVHGIGCWFGWF